MIRILRESQGILDLLALIERVWMIFSVDFYLSDGKWSIWSPSIYSNYLIYILLRSNILSIPPEYFCSYSFLIYYSLFYIMKYLYGNMPDFWIKSVWTMLLG